MIPYPQSPYVVMGKALTSLGFFLFLSSHQHKTHEEYKLVLIFVLLCKNYNVFSGELDDK